MPTYAHGDLRTLKSLQRYGWCEEPESIASDPPATPRPTWRAKLTRAGWKAQETIERGGNPFTGRLPMGDGFSPEQRRRARIGL